jgi:hypothetical protein
MTETVIYQPAPDPDAPPEPTLAESAAAFSAADAAVKTLEAKRDALALQIADINADIISATASRDGARERMSKGLGTR